MRFLPNIGLFQRAGNVNDLASGVRWSTQPTELVLGSLAYEDGSVYEYTQISGTCTVGDLLYYTGTNMGVVVKGATGVRPAGVSLVAPTASGDWTFMLKYGKHTSVQITATVAALRGTAALFGGMGSAAFNMSQQAAYASAVISAGGNTGFMYYIGQSLTTATGSQTVGFINLL